MFAWLGSKTGMRVVIIVLAVALVASIVLQVTNGQGLGGLLSGTATGLRGDDVIPQMTYALQVDGQVVGYFTSVSGLGSEHEIVEHRVVDDQGREVVRLIPGRLRWSQITLTRGLTSDMFLWNWRQAAVEGRRDEMRKNIAVVAMDASFQEIARWECVNAWPVGMVGGEQEGDEPGAIVESIRFAHEGLTRTK